MIKITNTYSHSIGPTENIIQMNYQKQQHIKIHIHTNKSQVSLAVTYDVNSHACKLFAVLENSIL